MALSPTPLQCLAVKRSPPQKLAWIDGELPPRGISSAELPVSSDRPMGLRASPGWAEGPCAKDALSPDPPAWDAAGALLPLPHLL